MKRWQKVVIFLTMVVLLVVGAALFYRDITAFTLPENKKMNVDRIYMHEPGRYSVMIKTGPKGEELEIIELRADRKIHIIADVPSQDPCWVYFEREKTMKQSWEKIWIHVHSPQDIQGGGWNHGKFGKGQTVIIE